MPPLNLPLETPSRILRRIEAAEEDPPSLPSISLPAPSDASHLASDYEGDDAGSYNADGFSDGHVDEGEPAPGPSPPAFDRSHSFRQPLADVENSPAHIPPRSHRSFKSNHSGHTSLPPTPSANTSFDFSYASSGAPLTSTPHAPSHRSYSTIIPPNSGASSRTRFAHSVYSSRSAAGNSYRNRTANTTAKTTSTLPEVSFSASSIEAEDEVSGEGEDEDEPAQKAEVVDVSAADSAGGSAEHGAGDALMDKYLGDGFGEEEEGENIEEENGSRSASAETQDSDGLPLEAHPLSVIPEDETELPTLRDVSASDRSSRSHTSSTGDRSVPHARAHPDSHVAVRRQRTAALPRLTHSDVSTASDSSQGTPDPGEEAVVQVVEPEVEAEGSISRASFVAGEGDEDVDAPDALVSPHKPSGLATPLAALGRRTPSPAPPTQHTIRFASASPFQQQPSLATPRAFHAPTEAERRKSILLSALKSTDRPRFAKGTPQTKTVSFSQAVLATPHSASHTSFTSDVSSTNDLVTPHRANTSFPGPGGDTKRQFNSSKLNSYLHTLNEHLTAENQQLARALDENVKEVNRLRNRNLSLEAALREVGVAPGDESDDGAHSFKLGTTPKLNDADDEQWRTTLQHEQERSAHLNDELEHVLRNHDSRLGILRELGEEISGRRGSSPPVEGDAELRAELERLRSELEDCDARIAELEQSPADLSSLSDSEGANAELHSLHARLQEAEEAASTRDAEVQALSAALASVKEAHAEQARSFTAKKQALEVELGKLVGELESRLAAREQELAAASIARDELGASLESECRERERLEDALAKEQGAEDVIRDLRQRVTEAEAALDDARRAAEKTQSTMLASRAAHECDVAASQRSIADLRERIAELEGSARHSAQEAIELRRALARSEELLVEERSQVAVLQAHIEVKDAQLTAQQSTIASLQLSREQSPSPTPRKTTRNTSRSFSTHGASLAEQEAFILSLENKLEDAHAEIARLRHDLVDSPARRSVIEAKDRRIELLEGQKAELEKRVASLRDQSRSAMFTPMQTPGGRESNASVLVHRSVLALKTPKTPGTIGNDSWLNQTTLGPEAGPLLAQIDALREQLEGANVEIDAKLEQLDAAGLDSVTLATRLAEAHERIAFLEAELERVLGDDGLVARARSRLARIKCPDCQVRFDGTRIIKLDVAASTSADLSYISTSTVGDTLRGAKKIEALTVALSTVRGQLSSLQTKWTHERDALQRENAVLKDTAARQTKERTTSVQRAQQELDIASKQHAQLRLELIAARSVVADLEGELRDERTRLRELTTEQSRLAEDKTSLRSRLSDSESELNAVRSRLKQATQLHEDLARQLKDTTSSNQATTQLTRSLERTIASNKQTIDRLREEKTTLFAERQNMQARLTELAQHADAVRDELATSQAAQAEARKRLEDQIAEVSQLRSSLDSKNSELRRVQGQKDRLASERAEILKNVASLEDDLRRVRQDSVQFGCDLAVLRRERDDLESRRAAEKAQVENAMQRSKDRIASLTRELETVRLHLQRVEESQANGDAATLAVERARHSKECKGLLVEIRYLKAKFSRESALRSDLTHQKAYLLLLVGGLRLTQKATIAAIARTGFLQDARPRPPTNKLKSAVLGVIAIIRMRALSRRWQEQRVDHDRLAAARRR